MEVEPLTRRRFVWRDKNGNRHWRYDDLFSPKPEFGARTRIDTVGDQTLPFFPDDVRKRTRQYLDVFPDLGTAIEKHNLTLKPTTRAGRR